MKLQTAYTVTGNEDSRHWSCPSDLLKVVLCRDFEVGCPLVVNEISNVYIFSFNLSNIVFVQAPEVQTFRLRLALDPSSFQNMPGKILIRTSLIFRLQDLQAGALHHVALCLVVFKQNLHKSIVFLRNSQPILKQCWDGALSHLAKRTGGLGENHTPQKWTSPVHLLSTYININIHFLSFLGILSHARMTFNELGGFFNHWGAGKEPHQMHFKIRKEDIATTHIQNNSKIKNVRKCRCERLSRNLTKYHSSF